MMMIIRFGLRPLQHVAETNIQNPSKAKMKAMMSAYDGPPGRRLDLDGSSPSQG